MHALAGPPLDSDLIEMWSDAMCDLSPATLAEYRRYIALYDTWLGAGRSLLDTTPALLRSFVAAHRRRWAPSTIGVVHRSFRSFFKWATAEMLMASDPSTGLRTPRVTSGLGRATNGTVRAQLVAVCKSSRDRALIQLLEGSGCRRGEAMALTVDNVNVADRVIQFTKTKSRKTRLAAMDREAAEAMAAWLTERARIATSSRALWIIKSNGTPLTPAAGKTILRRLANRAGVPYGSHDSRRAYAIRWLAAGGSTVGLRRQCGWETDASIERYTQQDGESLTLSEARRLFD